MKLSAIDMNLLVVLDALLKEQNITRAGDRLGLSQPATSNALSRLRFLLNDPLLEREGRHMRLSERAHLMKEPLRQALDNIRAALDESLAFDPSTAKFQVRIFASDQMTFLFLPKLRELVREQAPGVEMIFVWSVRARTFDMLENDEADVAIGRYEDAPTGVKRAQLFNDEIVVQGRKGHPAFERGMTMEQFRSYPWVSVSFEGRPSSYIEAALERAGVSGKSQVVLAHLLAAPLATWNSDLLTVVQIRMARRLALMMDLEWAPAPFPVEPLCIEMIWHEQSQRDPGLTWFRSQIQKVAEQL